MTKLNFAVHSPAWDGKSLESFNTILAIDAMLENSDCAFMFENVAVHDICQRNLGMEEISYANTNINRQIAQVVSSITASVRFDNPLNVDLTELKNALVPNPRLRLCPGHHTSRGNDNLRLQGRARHTSRAFAHQG